MDDLLYSPCIGVFPSSVKFIKPWGGSVEGKSYRLMQNMVKPFKID